MLIHSHQKPFDSSNVSNEFLEKAKNQGIVYDYEVFQNTFFSETEKNTNVKTRRFDAKYHDNQDDKVSDEFKLITEKHGISYNIETFQRAFGFSELEIDAAEKNSRRREAYQIKHPRTSEIYVQPAPNTLKKTEVNKQFVDALKANGIEYDLAAFQKAFGYADVYEEEMDARETRKQVKRTKGFIECKYCHIKFTNRNNFIAHTKTHKPKDKSIYCEDCSKQFKSPACLQLHLATDHGRSKGSVDCPICFKSYQDRTALRSHFYIHSLERQFLCGR